jgi:hypothetical protein
LERYIVISVVVVGCGGGGVVVFNILVFVCQNNETVIQKTGEDI